MVANSSSLFIYWFLALIVWISAATAGGQNFSPSDAKAVLKQHNEYRRLESAADMYRLYWNISLQQRADSWAQKCLFKHEHNFDLGENLYFDTDHENGVYLRGMKAWHEEKSSWSHTNKKCTGTCHFTQMVWAYTTTVGCSAHLCPNLNVAGKIVNNAMLFVCYYYPRGNFVSQFPYSQGNPCSKCATDDTCTDNLCVSSGPESKLAPAFVKSMSPLTPLRLNTDISSLEAFKSLSQEFSSQSHHVSKQSSHRYSSQTYQHKASSSSSSYTQTSHTSEDGGSVKTESHHLSHTRLRQENAIHQEHQWVNQAKSPTTTSSRDRHEEGKSLNEGENAHQTYVQSRKEEEVRRREEIRHSVSRSGRKEEESVSTSDRVASGNKEIATRDHETSLRQLPSHRHHSGTSVSEIKKDYRPPEDKGAMVTTTPRAERKRYEYEAPEHNEILRRNGATCADRNPECFRWATKCYRSAMVTLSCPLTCSKCAKNLTNVKSEQILKSSYHKSRNRKRHNPKIYHKPVKSRKPKNNEAREQRQNGQRHGDIPFRDQPAPDHGRAQPATTTEFWEKPQGAAAPMELRYSPAEGRYNPQISRPHAEKTATPGASARRRKPHTQARDSMCRDNPKHITSCKYWSKKGFCKANELVRTLYCRLSCASCG